MTTRSGLGLLLQCNHARLETHWIADYPVTSLLLLLTCILGTASPHALLTPRGRARLVPRGRTSPIFRADRRMMVAVAVLFRAPGTSSKACELSLFFSVCKMLPHTFAPGRSSLVLLLLPLSTPHDNVVLVKKIASSDALQVSSLEKEVLSILQTARGRGKDGLTREQRDTLEGAIEQLEAAGGVPVGRSSLLPLPSLRWPLQLADRQPLAPPQGRKFIPALNPQEFFLPRSSSACPRLPCSPHAAIRDAIDPLLPPPGPAAPLPPSLSFHPCHALGCNFSPCLHLFSSSQPLAAILGPQRRNRRVLQDPTTTAEINGVWRLLYTSRPSSSSPIQRTFTGIESFKVYQEVFLQAEVARINNCVDFGRKVLTPLWQPQAVTPETDRSHGGPNR